MVGLNEPELFERLKHYNLKIYCHKVSADLLSALPLYVHLTPYIVPLDSDNETTLNISSNFVTLVLSRIPERFLILRLELSVIQTAIFVQNVFSEFRCGYE